MSLSSFGSRTSKKKNPIYPKIPRSKFHKPHSPSYSSSSSSSSCAHRQSKSTQSHCLSSRSEPLRHGYNLKALSLWVFMILLPHTLFCSFLLNGSVYVSKSLCSSSSFYLRLSTSLFPSFFGTISLLCLFLCVMDFGNSGSMQSSSGGD